FRDKAARRAVSAANSPSRCPGRTCVSTLTPSPSRYAVATAPICSRPPLINRARSSPSGTARRRMRIGRIDTPITSRPSPSSRPAAFSMVKAPTNPPVNCVKLRSAFVEQPMSNPIAPKPRKDGGKPKLRTPPRKPETAVADFDRQPTVRFTALLVEGWRGYESVAVRPAKKPKGGHSSALRGDRACPWIQTQRHADSLREREDGVFPSYGFTTGCKP